MIEATYRLWLTSRDDNAAVRSAPETRCPARVGEPGRTPPATKDLDRGVGAHYPAYWGWGRTHPSPLTAPALA